MDYWGLKCWNWVLGYVNHLNTVDDIMALSYGNYGIFVIMGDAGFKPAAVCKVDLHKPGKNNIHSASSQPHPLQPEL